MRRRKTEVRALNESAYKAKKRNPQFSISNIAKRFSLLVANLMVYIKERDEELYNDIKKEQNNKGKIA